MSTLFAETLRKLREKRGLSQIQLGKQMFVNNSTIARWESGSRLPDAAMIARLSDVLDVDVGTLLSAAAESENSPNVILVDDSRPILTDGLAVLEEVMPNASITGFIRPREAVEYAKANRIALAVLDIELGTASGLNLCQALLEINPRANSDNYYYRGPTYPLLLLPLIAMLLLALAGVIRRRARLSPVVFLSFLVAIVPMTLTLLVHVFADVLPLVDIGFILSALAMYGLVLSDQIERDLRRQREIADQQLEIANQRVSLAVLQMRPHFIYNTLMGIYSLCNQDPQMARQVTMDFTNYLRKNFNAVASDHTIPFSTELEHTRAYLAVEKAQFEERLVVAYDTPFTCFRLPPLTLQPLVENAVKHGMDPDSGPLHITVRARHTDAGAEIVVTDDGRGFDPANSGEGHVTLKNIRQRLESMCGGSMTITSKDGGGTVVTMTIPDAVAE